MNDNNNIPYKDEYKKLGLYRNIYTFCLWGVNIISILYLFIQNIKICSLFDIIFKSIYITLIVFYFIIENYTEIFFYPLTAFNRRKGFIDNSLNSKLLEKKVENYYSNDEIKYGDFKLIVNCAENCFFTLNIAKASKNKFVIKNIFMIVLLIICAVVGIRDNIVFIPILQIALSGQFIAELLYLFNFILKLDQLFTEFKAFFEEENKKNYYIKQRAFLFFINYETILVYNKAPLDDATYKKIRDKLNNDWEDLKKRYGIN